MTESEPKNRQFITALARGLEVLRCFRPDDPALSNQELAARTGLPKPTISRLTHTLTELGYLVSSPRSGTFQLGPGVLALGYAMLAGIELRERARPAMEELARHASATVALGARDRLAVVYLEVARGPQIITLSRKVGARLPIQSTAMGRAILASLPPAERDYLLRALDEKVPDQAQQIRESVAEAMEQIEKQGFCTSFGDWIPDVNAVAAPVLSLDGDDLYAINVGGPSFMVSKERLTDDLGPRLAKVAALLGAPKEAILRQAHG
ncbi:MAG: IclR family transcriptional regulator [Alphaproteobacteria bacterium]|nr:IclR family transcriptional regulator [Alphaproteobacteria bacterium]